MRTPLTHVSRSSEKRRIPTNPESTSCFGSERPPKSKVPPSPKEPAEGGLEPGQAGFLSSFFSLFTCFPFFPFAVIEAVNIMHKELDDKLFKGIDNKNPGTGNTEPGSIKPPSDPPYIPTFVMDLEPELDKDDWLWGPLSIKGDALASQRILSLYSTLAGISGTSKVGIVCIIGAFTNPSYHRFTSALPSAH